MKRSCIGLTIMVALILMEVVSAGGIEPDAEPAPEGRAFAMDSWTVDAGGGASTGPTFAVTGSAGQPDAGLLAGGDLVLGGGFFGAALEVLFADGFESGDTSSWSSTTPRALD